MAAEIEDEEKTKSLYDNIVLFKKVFNNNYIYIL